MSRIKKIASLIALSTMLTACDGELESEEVMVTNSLDNGVVYEEIKYGELKNIFLPGEHVIAMPIKGDVYEESIQYPYITGYKPVGMSAIAYGDSIMFSGGGTILYVNTEEVLAYASGVNEYGEVIFSDFGVPLNMEENKDIEEDYPDICEFNIGEHIISIPFSVDATDNMVQFPVIPGYEIIGMAEVGYGKNSCFFGGGSLLLVNNEVVLCELVTDEEGNKSYSKIGTVKENKTLELE